MGIFGTFGAFSGLGKPTIKLEFEDNDALVAFQRRMYDNTPKESEPMEWDYERDEFKPVNGLGGKILTHDEFYNLITKDPAPNLDYYKQTPERVSEEFPFEVFDVNGKKYYAIKTPLKGLFSVVFLSAQRLRKHIKYGKHHIAPEAWAYVRQTLEKPNLVFVGNNAYVFVKPFMRKDGTPFIMYLTPIALTDKEKSIQGEVLSTYKLSERKKENKFADLYNQYKKGGGVAVYSRFLQFGNTVETTNEINGFDSQATPFVVDFRLICDNITNDFSNRQIFSEKNSLGAPGDTYVITDTRKKPRKDLDAVKSLQKYDIQPFNKRQSESTVNVDDNTLSPLMREYNAIKKKYNGAILLFEVGDYYESFYDDAVIVSITLNLPLTKRDGIDLCGFKKQLLDKYRLRLVKAGYSVAVCEQRYIDGDSLGKTANPLLYNNLDILEYNGMQPTYKQLPDYSQFFTAADHKNTFSGFGLDDTKKLIADTCRQHYKECAAIARHLKGDCKLQSAFNLWHWLHHNIRYEYDRDGREEIRTPLRVWADRYRGVDCDCLSVFSWCVLKCMGYNPVFELAAFKGKPAFSHIYINLDGIVIDRVWFIFNSRPPMITKTELFKVDLLTNLGQLF